MLQASGRRSNLLWSLTILSVVLLHQQEAVLADGENALDVRPSACADGGDACKTSATMSSSSSSSTTTTFHREYEQLPMPTERPKKKGAPSDPDKYGLVPPFLIGASSVIIIYIVAHCLYLHCYAKKKIRTLTEATNTSTQGPATLVVSADGPSTTSLAVRYDGAYGKTEIINATPYLLCQNNTSALPAGVSMYSESTPPSQYEPEHADYIQQNTDYSQDRAQANKANNFRANHPGRPTGSRPVGGNQSVSPRKSLCSGPDDSSGCGAMADATGDPASGSTSGGGCDRGSLCFVPIGRAMSDQHGAGGARRPEWTPVQDIMYDGVDPNHEMGVMKRDPSHTLVFVPVNSQQVRNNSAQQYSNMQQQQQQQQQQQSEGNASNMAVPHIIEDLASDQGSRESSTCIEHEALIHDTVSARIGEHAV